jgi:hypothetical protein
MKLLVLLALAVCMTGCAGMTTQEKRAGFTVLGVVAGVALISTQINDDEDESAYCKTVTRPNGGGGIATNETFCTQ